MKKILTREDYHQEIGNKIFGENDCPFCDLEGNKERVLWKWKKWFIIQNKYPYSGEENHLMLVPYKHIIFSHELSSDETKELSDAYKWIKDFYDDQIYFSCTRESMTNRSVEHLHMHFLPGRLQGKYLRYMLMKQGFPVEEDLERLK